MPGYKYPKQAAPQTDEAETVEEKEQTQDTIPQAPFGAQPMTPVSPAPKVGGITGNAKAKK